MSKSVWFVLSMGLVSMLVLAVGMMMTLGQFQETPAAEWVKLAELIGREFKANPVSVRVTQHTFPVAIVINYTSLQDSHFNLSAQNQEMESIAKFALSNYKERRRIEEVRLTRTEIHGRGCFKQTYVSYLTVQNTTRGGPGIPPALTPGEPERR